MCICLPRVSSLFRVLIAGVGFILASSPTRADFVINSGTAVNFSDAPGQNQNDGGNLSIQNGGASPTVVTFVAPGWVGADLSINGTSVVIFPTDLLNFDPNYLVVGGNVNAYDSSTVNLAGGNIGGNLYAYNSSNVNISLNGSVGGDYNGAGSTTTNMSGGSLGGNVYLQDNSVLNLSGGIANGNINLQDNSVLNLSGGIAGANLNLQGNSVVNLSGGIVGGNISLQDNSSLNVFGSLTVTGGNGDYFLYGTLADGTDLGPSGIEVFTGSGNPISVNPVPEPSGFVLLLVGSGSILGWRSAARRRGADIRSGQSKSIARS